MHAWVGEFGWASLVFWGSVRFGSVLGRLSAFFSNSSISQGGGLETKRRGEWSWIDGFHQGEQRVSEQTSLPSSSAWLLITLPSSFPSHFLPLVQCPPLPPFSSWSFLGRGIYTHLPVIIKVTRFFSELFTSRSERVRHIPYVRDIGSAHCLDFFFQQSGLWLLGV